MNPIYDTLNDVQKEAVFHTEGPLLILAGAGSGKTRVLTHRIAYLIEEKQVNPWNILAITFTNKAAGEMRERVDDLVGFGSESIWVSTFHSTCVRILRRYIERLGYGSNFAIYDADDQKTLMKDICKRLEIDTKQYKEKAILAAISAAKDELITPAEYEKKKAWDFTKRKIAEAYREYQLTLMRNNALDFDDLIMKTVELFRSCPDALEYYQNRFRYMMVDEYQDTNTAQFRLISLLADRYRNLCVVGDDDQSIYKFRGANIGNILNFEKDFEDTRVIRLEQNYRSTQTILDAANGVIRNNEGRKEKTLWTQNGRGSQIQVRQCLTGFEEAEYVAGDIRRRQRQEGCRYSDCAVLYRTNAQSRLFEEKLLLANIPYKIVGGINFYARREIKDLLSFLKTVDNAKDDLAVRRIINIPRRGIGAATIAKVQNFALNQGVSFYEGLKRAAEVPGIGRAAAKVGSFVTFIQTLRSQAEFLSVKELLETILEATGYVTELEAEGTDEAKDRIENINELISKVVTYQQQNREPSLGGFLEEVALVADIDEMDEEQDRVLLMTLHSAKGLEFQNVYLTGMEEGLFPAYASINSGDPSDLEEERRLCYVGITRAREHLTMTCAKQRMVHGETKMNAISRFLREVPLELLEIGGDYVPTELRPKRDRQGTLPSRNFRGTEKLSAGGRYRSAEAFSVGGGYHSAEAFSVGGGYRSAEAFSAGGGYRSSEPYSSSERYRAAGHSPGSEFPGGENHASATENPYQSARKSFRQKAFDPKQYQVKKADSLDYGVGDRVQHIKFGEGTVRAITEGGRDYEVTVDFDRAGVKKMFAAFAKLRRISE